jgi:hypothetical protein
MTRRGRGRVVPLNDSNQFVVMTKQGSKMDSGFEKAADDVRYMFDIEKADVQVLRPYARRVIGFQLRDYLNNLLLSDSTLSFGTISGGRARHQ